jgi:plasmid maintenance system killer protein
MKDRFLLTDNFVESISNFDKGLKASLWKCLQLLSKNFLHPSLNTEKLNGIYSSRINIGYRLIHEPSGKLFRLLFAGKHDDAYRFASNYKKEMEEFLRKPQYRLFAEEGVEYKAAPEPRARVNGVRHKKVKLGPIEKLSSKIRLIIARLRKPRTVDELVPFHTYSLRKLRKYFR